MGVNTMKPWEKYTRQTLQPMTKEQRLSALDLAKQIRPQTNKTFGDSLSEDMADLLYGADRAISGATLGGYDWLKRKTGLGLNQDDYLAMKEYNEGSALPAKVAGFASEVGGNVLGGGGAIGKGLLKRGLRGSKLATTSAGLEGLAYGVTGSDTWGDLPKNVAISTSVGAGMGKVLPLVVKPLNPVINKVNRQIGQKNLLKQLKKTDDFEDVFLGNIEDDFANRLNIIRNAEKVSPIENSDITITGNGGIDHVYKERVIGDKYTPEKTAEVIDFALFSKNPRIVKGNLVDNQVIFDSSNPANKVVVSKNDNTKGISIVTAMQDKSLGKKNKRLGGLPFPPYEANITSDVSTAAGSLKIPDFQPLDTNSVTPLVQEVNPFEKRSFVEALADRDKARVLRNGVLSGAGDLSERARILQDNLTKRKNGWYDPDFEKLIKTSKLKEAENEYAKFMNNNGGKTLSAEKVEGFYQNHPIARDIISEMRDVDPRAFDNIAPGSLAEFDMLKKILREEAGNKIKVGASKSGALKRAENSLKDLMESEFSGFKSVNKDYAEASALQDIFESKLKQGISSVGGGTANVSPFWSGISSPLTAAGVVGGFFDPSYLSITAAGLGGKALMRNYRRNAARNLADGIIKTPVVVNPTFVNGLSAPALKNISNRND